MIERMNKPHIRLRTLNNCLTAVVALLALYIIAAPFWPQITWWVRHDTPVSRITTHVSVNTGTTPPPVATVQGDRLIIPALDMQEDIHEGNLSALRLGVWRLPHTSSPDKGGNTVLVGHRFTYSGAAVFYHLDKVQVGDPITLNWHGKVYRYEVTSIKVVPPTEVSVEANTKEPLLTIYTCTPLLTAKDRLVIQATPIEEAP